MDHFGSCQDRGGGRIEPATNANVGLWIDLELGQFAGFERHDLPTGHGCVGSAAGLITPAAALLVLRFFDEVERTLGRLAEFFIAGHAVRFTERDRGDAMAIEPSRVVRDAGFGHVQIAVRTLIGNEIRQAAGDLLLVFFP